jgi:hypothetical protein
VKSFFNGELPADRGHEHMHRLAWLMLLSGCVAGSAWPEDTTPVAGHWLMLVATKNLEPAREAEFNHWYDDIDIPDVLKVPGYKRARRGVRQTVSGFSTASQEAAEGRYVALYDIETPNMDRTIIDMLMAAKKMDMTGRSIAALKVSERVYFRRLGGPVFAPNAAPKSGITYLYLERVACCRDEATEVALNDWYDNTHIPDILAARIEGLLQIERFVVYRVAMVETLQVPRFLTVYEFDAGSADEVVAEMRHVNEGLKKSDRMSEWFVESNDLIVKQIKDVRRQ